MKHKIAILPLVLVLIIGSILPMNAAAESEYDQYIIGNWKLKMIYKAEEKQLYPDESGACTASVYRNGTMEVSINGNIIRAGWHYDGQDEDGYRYVFELSDGQWFMLYCTEGSVKGSLLLIVPGFGIMSFEKA